MHTVDKNLIGTDPITRRTFCWGHPDSAWMLAIIFSITSLVLTGLGVYQITEANQQSKLPIIGVTLLLTGIVGYMPPAILIMKRKALTLYWVLGLLTWVLILGICIFMIDLVTPKSYKEGFFAVSLIITFHSYIAYYVYGLVKDKLLYSKSV